MIGHWLWRWLPGWVRRLLLWRLNAHFIVGTVAVVRDTQGRVLLARHTYRRLTRGRFPAGGCDGGKILQTPSCGRFSRKPAFA